MFSVRWFLLVSFLFAGASQVPAPDPQAEVWTSTLQELDRAMARDASTGEVIWLPVSSLETFLNLSSEELAMLGVQEAEQTRYNFAVLNHLRIPQLESEGRLSPSGECRPPFSKHSESFYLTQEEATSAEPLATIRGLVERAESVAVLQINSVEQGFSRGLLRRRLLASVQADLNPQPTFLDSAVEVQILQDTFDVQLRGTRICERRPGYYEPQPGDEVLVLGRYLPETREFLVANLFEIQGGLVLPQPYSFLQQEPLALGDLE